jgi:hypothetical protein
VNNSPLNYTDPTGHDADCGTTEGWCKELVELEEQVDREFDPYTGIFENAEDYNEGDIPISEIDARVADAYGAHGYSFDSRPPQNNPVTVEKFNEMEEIGDIGGYLGHRMILSINHEPYTIFLRELELSTDQGNYTTNYESNYLAALMKNNPTALMNAKNKYLQILITRQDNFMYDFIASLFKDAEITGGGNGD